MPQSSAKCRQKPQTCNFLTCPESKRDAGAAFGLVSSGQSKKERTHPQIEFISTAPGIERTRQKKCGKKIRARRIFVAWPAGRHSTGMRLCNQFSSWDPLARGAWRASCHVRVSGRSGRGETAELLERPYPPSLPSESPQRRRGTAPPSLRSATDTHKKKI